MKKINKILFLLVLVTSCSVTNMNITRKRGYELNSEYINKIYNVKVNNKNTGFYFSKNKYEFYTLVDNMIYKIVLDKDGNLIENDLYPAYSPE